MTDTIKVHRAKNAANPKTQNSSKDSQIANPGQIILKRIDDMSRLLSSHSHNISYLVKSNGNAILEIDKIKRELTVVNSMVDIQISIISVLVRVMRDKLNVSFDDVNEAYNSFEKTGDEDSSVYSILKHLFEDNDER